MRPTVLYISYDGMLEPLGESQVLGYLEPLARDYDAHLISFEKKKDRQDGARVAAMRARLESAGIAWHPLAYHKAPSAPATAYDIAAGTCLALALSTRHRFRIVHARSYVPAMMALAVKRATGARFLFDMRGFWAEERTDAGIWPADGRIYRTVKALERRFLLGTDHVVTLTKASVPILEALPYLAGRMPPMTVIPTCANLELFSPGPPSAPVVEDGQRIYTIGYTGSIGTWYMFDECLRFYAAFERRRPGARLLIVNRNEQDYARRATKEAGIPQERVEITSAAHRDVPALNRRMDAGLAIIKPVFSKISSAPTKTAEYLGCGVPCVGNVGVGDMEEILEGERVGVALRDFSDADHEGAVDRLLALLDDPATPARCRAVAERRFSLASGVARYREIYQSLLGESRGKPR